MRINYFVYVPGHAHMHIYITSNCYKPHKLIGSSSATKFIAYCDSERLFNDKITHSEPGPGSAVDTSNHHFVYK